MGLQSAARTVIVGDDSLEDRSYLETVLQSRGYEVRLAEDGKEVLGLLQSDSSVSLVLLDVRMPVMNGVDTLRELRRRHDGLPVVLMSGSPVSASTLRTIEQYDARFLEKPIFPEDLSDSFEVELPPGLSAPRPDAVWIRDSNLAPSQTYMRKIESLITQVGSADVPVLLRGETGTGKEVLARRIHACSPRAKKPFVKINCAALPSELVESELFGYEKGAFTGAWKQCPGLFEAAQEGTILLDEIGDMDVRLQAKLLQVLQDGEFHRLGSRDLVRVDVRIMAATHQDLRGAIRDGRFREDLYYRLNVVSIRIPPLRERRDEILLLAEHFLQKYATGNMPPPVIPGSLRERMLRYEWPGNVRELENAMRRFLVVRDPVSLCDDLSTPDSNERSLPARSPATSRAAAVEAPSEQADALARAARTKYAAEREAVLAALEATHWNRKLAAELLGIDYKACLYKMKKLGIGAKSRVLGKASSPTEKRPVSISVVG